MSFDWEVSATGKNGYCPGCIIQFYAGMKGSFSACFFSNVVAPNTGTSTGGKETYFYRTKQTWVLLYHSGYDTRSPILAGILSWTLAFLAYPKVDEAISLSGWPGKKLFEGRVFFAKRFADFYVEFQVNGPFSLFYLHSNSRH